MTAAAVGHEKSGGWSGTHRKMTGEAFEGYFRQFVVPELTPGGVVLVDNLSAHKLTEITQLVESAHVWR